MRKSMLMSGTALGRRGWTPSERRLGRMLRNPEGEHDGGGDSSATGNNGDGNSTTDGQSQESQNNDGQSFDFSQFWNQETQQTEGDSSQGDDDGDTGTQLGQQIMERVTNFKAEDIFTPDAIAKMRDGDLSDLNSGIAKVQQESMKQVLGMTAMMMQAFESSMMKRVMGQIQNSVQGAQTSQKDEQLLSETFPSFNQPQTRPLIQGVFNQSLKHSKGDRTKALELTRGMLQMMGQTGFQDFGLPKSRNSDDNLGDGPSRLVEELIGRG